MTTETGPARTLSLDAAAQRRRALGSGAGVVVVIGIVVTGMALAGGGSTSPAPAPVVTQAALAAPSHAPAAATTAAPATTVTASPAVTPTASRTTPAGPASTRTTTRLDVDGDGKADTASVRFTSKRAAQVVVHLGSGKTLRSRAFPLYKQEGAGEVSGADLTADGRSELLVSDPGADGIGYELFQLVRSALVEVAAPKGQNTPYLYIGGGMYYESTFDCSGHQLLQVNERPAVKDSNNLPADPAFLVTTTAYTLTDGVLTKVGSNTAHAASRAAAAALLRAHGNGCGAKP